MKRRSKEERRGGDLDAARLPRAPLPPRASGGDEPGGLTHEQMLESLRAIEGLMDVGRDPPNFHFRSRPFLHFHLHDEGMSADVRFGSGDFEPVWVSTPAERRELLARVADHVERLQLARKSAPRRSRRDT